jgi:hypothetical protein
MASLAILAFLTESMTEYLFGKIAKLDPWKKYLAIALGVVLALIFNVDVFRDILKMATVVPFAGSIVTGVILGRGSNYLHDVVNLVQSISLVNVTKAANNQEVTAVNADVVAEAVSKTAEITEVKTVQTKEM